MKINLGSSLVDDILMITLALISVLLLVYEAVVTVSFQTQQFIHYTDITIALIFLLEFLVRLVISKNKMKFFLSRWWELLAAIPITSQTTQALRTLKIARIIPLLESLRLVRLTVRLKLILEASRKYTKHAYLIYLVTIIVSVILLGAFAFNYFEAGKNPRVNSFFDSVWWSIVTIATIGYGDIYPITVGGRIVAIILIFTGIGALGAFIATIQAYVINRSKSEIRR